MLEINGVITYGVRAGFQSPIAPRPTRPTKESFHIESTNAFGFEKSILLFPVIGNTASAEKPCCGKDQNKYIHPQTSGESYVETRFYFCHWEDGFQAASICWTSNIIYSKNIYVQEAAYIYKY